MRDDYAVPTGMTDAGSYRSLLADLPSDVAGLAAVGHGLMMHEFHAWAYGVRFTEQTRMTVHIRPVARLLERILSISSAPLATPREPAQRVAVNCRHFTVLLVSALRAKGVPARARCGFGGYFLPDFFEDHWVAEYWTGDGWRLVDAQIDDVQRETLAVDFDVTDVPRDRFLVGGDAWVRYRAGELPQEKCGLSITKESGAWWIAGNLMRDAAALSKIELLPWDEWGAMPAPEAAVTGELAELFDALAEATLHPEQAGLAELMSDPRLRVPGTVRNAPLGIEETL
jgi:hypothetical protein